MSWRATAYVEDRLGMPSGAKGLLYAIAAVASHDGVTITGRASLAVKCCCSEKTVTERMRVLERLREIKRFERRRANGSRTSDYIVLAPFGDRGEMEDAEECKNYPHDVFDAATSPYRVGEVSSPDLSARHVKFSPGSGEVSGLSQVTFSGGPDPSEEPLDDPRVRDPARNSAQQSRESDRSGEREHVVVGGQL